MNHPPDSRSDFLGETSTLILSVAGKPLILNEKLSFKFTKDQQDGKPVFRVWSEELFCNGIGETMEAALAQLAEGVVALWRQVSATPEAELNPAMRGVRSALARLFKDVKV